mgnify:CR=1 FL=1
MMTSYQSAQTASKKQPEEPEPKKTGRGAKKNKTKVEALAKVEPGSVEGWDPAEFKLNSKNTYINKIQTLFNETEVQDVVPMYRTASFFVKILNCCHVVLKARNPHRKKPKLKTT